jgi:WD repeat-containing protein 68
LRLWELYSHDETTTNSLDDQGKPLVHYEIAHKATLANVRKNGQNKKEYSAPVTSFDWNESDSKLLVTR